MNKKNIPSPEDFARAKAAMRYRDRGLSEVSQRVLGQFQSRGVHEFFILFSPRMNSFGAYVFYETDNAIAEAEESGLSSEIREFVFDKLVEVGRGERETLNVTFDFDSHENVVRHYEGDYYLRLR